MSRWPCCRISPRSAPPTRWKARLSFKQLAQEFGFEKIGRAPARFDPEELKRVNAAVLHQTDYGAVRDRLSASGADKGEAFWNAIRANIVLLPEVRVWAHIVDGPIEPLVADAAFATAAAEVLPKGAYDATSWSAFTNAVKEKTGAKGKALFMPLRQALTGLDHGPEMAALFPLIGEQRAKAAHGRGGLMAVSVTKPRFSLSLGGDWRETPSPDPRSDDVQLTATSRQSGDLRDGFNAALADTGRIAENLVNVRMDFEKQVAAETGVDMTIARPRIVQQPWGHAIAYYGVDANGRLFNFSGMVTPKQSIGVYVESNKLSEEVLRELLEQVLAKLTFDLT